MRRIFLLAVLGCALALAATPVGADGGEPDPDDSFTYEAPASLSGPMALRFVVDFGDEQDCMFRVWAAGTTRRPPILMWEESNGRAGAFFSSYTAHAHTTVAGHTADSRTLLAPGGAWAFDGTAESRFGGVLDYRLVLPQAGAWENAATGYHPAARIEVACEQPISVDGFQASREAVVFKADSMAGGTGASVYQPLGGSVNVNAGDELRAAFASDVVRLRVTDHTISSEVEGQLALSAPAGDRAWTLDGAEDITHEDGPGEYALTLDRRAAGYSDRLLGVLYGLTPVDDLSDVLS